MATKDLYEDLLRFYEFQLGKMPHREEFHRALQATFSEQNLFIFFLLPFLGQIPQEKFEKKTLKHGISADDLQATLKHLVPQGLVDTYVSPKGRVYSRAPIIALLELQVRLIEDSPMRAACTKVMNAFIEGAVNVLPTRTPYYRVLPVEQTLTGTAPAREITLNLVVPDPRAVLPIDIISEMIKKEEIIAISDCYCRATKRLVDEDCGHPLQTCFYFNELALVKLETGYARRIYYDEAMHILYECEKEGLVHNVSNCKGKIQTLCNCCTCSCGVLKAVVRGQTNVSAPSRYVAVLEPDLCRLHGECVQVCPVDVYEIIEGKLIQHIEKCIGCGHCVHACPENALHMELRRETKKIYPDNDSLFRQINLEAITGLAIRKLEGK